MAIDLRALAAEQAQQGTKVFSAPPKGQGDALQSILGLVGGVGGFVGSLLGGGGDQKKQAPTDPEQQSLSSLGGDVDQFNRIAAFQSQANRSNRDTERLVDQLLAGD